MKIEGKLKNGFEFSIDEEVLDDWEVLEVLCEIDQGNLTHIVDIMKLMLGDEQYIALKDYLRKKEKKVKISTMSETLRELLSASNNSKNS